MRGRRSASRKRSIDGGEKTRVLVGTIHWKPPPIGALPQIGEEPIAILMKMQKGSTFEIENPWSALDESRPGPETFQ